MSERPYRTLRRRSSRLSDYILRGGHDGAFEQKFAGEYLGRAPEESVGFTLRRLAMKEIAESILGLRARAHTDPPRIETTSEKG